MSVATSFGAIKLSYRNPETEETIEESIVCNYTPSIELVQESDYDGINNENISPSTKVTCIESSPVKSGIFKCTECIFTCVTTTDLADHFHIHRIKDPFKCFKCGYEGSNNEDFIEHSITHIENNHYKCSKCKFKTVNIKAIKSHILKHEVQTFSCSICFHNFSTAEDKSDHEQSCRVKRELINDDDDDDDDGQDDDLEAVTSLLLKLESDDSFVVNQSSPVKFPLTCPTCYFIFNSKDGLTEHIYETHLRNWEVKRSTKKFKKYMNDVKPKNPYVSLERMYLCGFCNFIFETDTDFESHNVIHQTNTMCSICYSHFFTITELRKHRTTKHTTSPQLPCDYCNEFFTNAAELINHINIEHDIKSAYPCPHCPRFIKSEAGLKQHLMGHDEIKSFNCNECKYIAITPSDFRKHKNKHEMVTLSCPKGCGKKFKYEALRQSHLESCGISDVESDDSDYNDEDSSESDVPFVDDLNDKDFVLSSTPIEIDTTQKENAICSECNENFDSDAELKSHLLKHYDNKQFKCLTCGNMYDKANELALHDRVHTGAPIIKCDICGKEFLTASRLKRHSASHTDIRPHECRICGSFYKTRDTMQKHVRAIHASQVYECKLCKYTTGRKENLIKHLSSHEKYD